MQRYKLMCGIGKQLTKKNGFSITIYEGKYMRLCKSSCVNLICLPITSIRGHSMPVSNMRWVFSHPLTHISLSLMNRGFQG